MNPRHLLSAAAFAAVAAALPAQVPATVEPPRLVVLCSVDQLGRWVLQGALPHCGNDGFRRLQREGLQFDNCAYVHGCTETGPGHATLGTGAPARLHGIVHNHWFQLTTGKAIYCVDDEAVAALPDLPEGKARGPGLLLAPTLGDSLKAHVPGARVVSVSWKDRAAILMAGRSADVVCWIEAATGRLVTNTAWVASTPAWLTKFNTDKAIDGFFGWKWDRVAGADAYAGLVDDRPFEAPHPNGSKERTLPQPVTGGLAQPGPAYYADVCSSPVGNEVVLLAAEAAIAANELGADAAPDLLCVSFSATDYVGHTFGPDSVEARDTLLRLDEQLARLLRFLDEKVGKGRYAFLLGADHGVGPTPEAAKAAHVDAGRGPLLARARAAAEKAVADRFGERTQKKAYLLHPYEPALFFDRSVIAEVAAAAGRPAPDVLREASAIAAGAALKAPGVLEAFVTEDLQKDGPGEEPLRRAMFFAASPERAGDVLLVWKPYWLDGMTPASHGSPHAYDREIPALAMGPGVAGNAHVVAPVSPGVLTVLASRLLRVPKPAMAPDEVPAGVFYGPR